MLTSDRRNESLSTDMEMNEGAVMDKVVRRILFATDLRNLEKQGLDLARAMAASFGAELHILHVVPDVPGIDKNELQTRSHAARHQLLQQLGSEQDVVVVVGNIIQEITSYVEAHQIDFVFLGSHGHDDGSRLTITEMLDRLVPCPILKYFPPIGAVANAASR